MKKTICKVAGCCRLAIPPHKYCLEHQAQERAELERGQVYYAKARHNVWATMYASPKWKTLRSEKLRANPYCEKCGAEATEVHHIVPHNGDLELFYDYDNLMSICHACHVRETQKESEARKKDRNANRGKLWY